MGGKGRNQGRHLGKTFVKGRVRAWRPGLFVRFHGESPALATKQATFCENEARQSVSNVMNAALQAVVRPWARVRVCWNFFLARRPRRSGGEAMLQAESRPRSDTHLECG